MSARVRLSCSRFLTTVVCKRSNTHELGNLPSVELPHFGQLRDGHSRHDFADAGYGVEQFRLLLSVLVLLNGITDQAIDFFELLLVERDGFVHEQPCLIAVSLCLTVGFLP